jgi:hypothetical protein
MTIVDDAAVSRGVIDRVAEQRAARRAEERAAGTERYARRKAELDARSRLMPTSRSEVNSATDANDADDETAEAATRLAAPPSASAVVGLDGGGRDDEAGDAAPRGAVPRAEPAVQELPPWEAMAPGARLNLRTGRFDVGVPAAEYTEDSTGRIRVRQPLALRGGRFRVDEALLPEASRARIRDERHEDEERRAADAADWRTAARANSAGYKRIRALSERLKARAALERAASGLPAPLARPQRMSMKFRSGSTPPVLRQRNARPSPVGEAG